MSESLVPRLSKSLVHAVCTIFGMHNLKAVADLAGGGGGGGGGAPGGTGAGAPPPFCFFITLFSSLLTCCRYVATPGAWLGLLSSQYRALPETERLGNMDNIVRVLYYPWERDHDLVYPSVYVRITFVGEI